MTGDELSKVTLLETVASHVLTGRLQIEFCIRKGYRIVSYVPQEHSIG